MSRGTLDPAYVRSAFMYGAFTLCGRLSQNRSISFTESFMRSVTPACTHAGLGSSHFARRYFGNRVFFLFSGYLDVSVPRVRFLNPMYSGKRYLVNPIVDRPKATTIKFQVGFPIRKSMDQSLFSAPHGLSQSITSFIASYCQGIHQTPLSRLT